MFRFSGKKFVVASVACLLLVACLGTQVATADFDVQLAPRYVDWEWASDYLDCSMGYGEDGSPDGLWVGDLSESAQSPDGYLQMSMSAYQSSMVGPTALSVTDATAAIVQGLDPLIGTQVGTTAHGRSGYYIKFTVTEETPRSVRERLLQPECNRVRHGEPGRRAERLGGEHDAVQLLRVRHGRLLERKLHE
ncbi:MAG: hypothetical protein PVJ57_16065 [Phycisphaerae bacterium]|jgi:hypothetical protein